MKCVLFCAIFAFSPGMVPEGEGVFSLAKAATRAAPTTGLGGQGRHTGLPLRWIAGDRAGTRVAITTGLGGHASVS